MTRGLRLNADEFGNTVARYRAESRSQIDIPPRVPVSLQIQLQSNERRFAKELHKALGLASPDHQLVELLNRYHYYSFLALPGDQLRPFRSGQSKHLAEARLAA